MRFDADASFGDDYLHFCLAPTTEKPGPCPVRSPGILRLTRAITHAVAAATSTP